MTSFFAPRPWVGFLVLTDGVGAAGYNTTGISVSRSNNGLFPAHPKGSEYLLMLTPYATSTGTTTTFPTGYSQTATAFYVYCRSGIGITTFVNGNFYVSTVP